MSHFLYSNYSTSVFYLFIFTFDKKNTQTWGIEILEFQLLTLVKFDYH